MIGIGDFDTAALFEPGVRWEDDGFSRTESFKNETMAVLGIAAELDAPHFCLEVGRNDPDLSIAGESFFGNVKSQSA